MRERFDRSAGLERGGDFPLLAYSGVKMWWKAIDSIMRPTMQGAPQELMDTIEPWEMQKSTDSENILRAMDKYGVDVSCLLPEAMMDTTGFSSRWCTKDTLLLNQAAYAAKVPLL